MRHSIGILLLLLAIAVVTYRGLSNGAFHEKLIFRPDRIWKGGEYYRLFSSALLHADWYHFFFNAITISSFGETIETFYGLKVMLALFGGSVLLGNLLALWLHRHESYSALGASGGACGLVFACLFLVPGSSVTMFPLPISVSPLIYAPLFLLVSYFGVRVRGDNIGHDAHLGGALGGLAITFVLFPQRMLAQPGLLAIVALISIVLLILLIRFPHSREIVPRFWKEEPHRSTERYQRYDEALERGRTRDRLDQLLDKVASKGMGQLSRREQFELKELAARLKK